MKGDVSRRIDSRGTERCQSSQMGLISQPPLSISLTPSLAQPQRGVATGSSSGQPSQPFQQQPNNNDHAHK